MTQDTWDSYVGGSALGPADQMWNFNMDLTNPLGNIDGLAPQGTEQAQQQSDGQVNGAPNGGLGGGPFMGVSTPPKNTLM